MEGKLLFFFLLVRYSLGVVGGVDASDFFFAKLQWKQDKVLGMWQREVKEVDGECRVYVYDPLE